LLPDPNNPSTDCSVILEVIYIHGVLE